MSSQPSASNCPNCNAPLPLDHVPLTQTQVKCEYCGSLVNIRDRAAPTLQQTIIINNQPTGVEDMAAVTVNARRVSGLAALVFACIPLAIVGAAAYFAISTFNQAMNTTVSTISNIADVPKSLGDLPKLATTSALGNAPFGNPTAFYARGDGAPPDLISVMRDEKDTNRLLSMNVKDKAARWKGEALSKEAYNAKIATGKGLVFVNEESKLSAYNADTGATAWSVSLASAPPTNCETCVRVLGEQVVSFGRDGTLQGFDAATGKPLWNKRLDPSLGKPLDVAGRLVVADAISATRQSLGHALVVMDPATGEAKQRVEASCGVGNSRAFVRSDRYYFSPDGNAAYVVFGGADGGAGGSGCAQRYDLNTGKQAWSLAFKPDDAFPFSIASWVSVLPTNDALYVLDDGGSNGASLNIVDAKTGKSRHFTLDKQYRMKVKDANADTLIVEASPRFDSQRSEYWGVNTANGERRWQFALNKGTRLDSSTARLTPNGFVVLQCGDNPDKALEARCTFDKLDPKTGVSSGQVPHILRGTSLGLKPKWSDNNVWLISFARALGLNLADGKAQFDLP